VCVCMCVCVYTSIHRHVCVFFASLALETEVYMPVYITLSSQIYTYRTRRMTC
jgi:hypothetical protein